MGRPSIPPEILLKALLLQALYSVRSERQLVEQIQLILLYRLFIDLSLDAPVWDATSFFTYHTHASDARAVPDVADLATARALIVTVT